VGPFKLGLRHRGVALFTLVFRVSNQTASERAGGCTD
jgi:hypothetical protein